jgi:hypothetical protein
LSINPSDKLSPKTRIAFGSAWRSEAYKSEHVITESEMHRFIAKLSVSIYRFVAVKCVFCVILSDAKNL